MSVFILATIIAIILPIMCLSKTRVLSGGINTKIIFFLALLFIQIIVEGILAYYEYAYLIKYISAMFVLSRLIYIIYLYRFKNAISETSPFSYYLISITYWSNFIFWLFILHRLILKF